MAKEHSHKWYRDKLTHLEQLLADESHYCPYSDAELSDILGMSPETVRYYRVNYFGLGNRHERRYHYLKGDHDANRKQDERAAAEGKSRSEAVEERATAGRREIAGDN